MTSLAVQLVSPSLVHCFAEDGGAFSSYAPSKLLELQGVRGRHLVTAECSRERWCLVMELLIATDPSNAEALEELFCRAAELLSLDAPKWMRPLTRRDAGVASDIYDWLRL